MKYKIVIFLSILPVVSFSSDSTDYNSFTSRSLPIQQDQNYCRAQLQNQSFIERQIMMEQTLSSSIGEHAQIIKGILGMMERLSGQLQAIQVKQNMLERRLKALEEKSNTDKP